MEAPLKLPPIIKRPKADSGLRCPAHLNWVRRHACCACGATAGIEAAHVRTGTFGGMGMKPSDKWALSLCGECHSLQHRLGEQSFSALKAIDMRELAEAFYRASPHRHKLHDHDPNA